MRAVSASSRAVSQLFHSTGMAATGEVAAPPKVAVVQMCSTADRDANWRACESMVRRTSWLTVYKQQLKRLPRRWKLL